MVVLQLITIICVWCFVVQHEKKLKNLLRIPDSAINHFICVVIFRISDCTTTVAHLFNILMTYLLIVVDDPLFFH